MYTIQYVESIAGDLAGLRSFERKRILDEIEEQLTHEPVQETKRKKILRGLKPPWEHAEPVWELRVDEFRVFYDVDETARQVTVRAVRHKPAHKTTEEIL
jgi:mRNA-degrading endonuclease RelE of RelBE toxin-antitoxin system